MHSRTNWINSSQVHQWALEHLLQADLLKAHGRVCTVVVVWSIVLRAAARMVSIFAACQDMANAPSSQAVFDALQAGLPKTLAVLQRRLNESLTNHLPRRMRRRAWQVAIDWHLVPYYGEPESSRNELFHYKAHLGTTTFHAYATACIVEYGQRYTLALSWVRKHESPIKVLGLLLDRMREIELKIKRLLLDRYFFRADVIALLQQEKTPFLMPVVMRGRKPKRRRPRTGLRFIERQKAGWYTQRTGRGKDTVEVSICVSYRTYCRRGEKKRRTQKLLFAAWHVTGTPTEIRELYRKRFGIETSYRQRRQARIYTCTRNPHLRLLFVAISLLLRNLWVWIHATHLNEGSGDQMTLRLERLRFKRLLEWLNQAVIAVLHDDSMFCVDDES
jgi:DDE family transposase